MILRTLILGLGLLCAAIGPATAQDAPTLGQAERGAVRVVLIIETFQGRYLHSTGSGFVAAPNLVVTNAHVIAPAREYPGISAAVILPDGEGPVNATIAAYSGAQDLAILRFGGPSPEPIAISTVEPRAGDNIISLGYPDVDDLERPAIELVRPTAPSRTGGAIASLRDRAPTGQPIPTINHEAAISSGSSGGPLLDPCGRIIGVNTWHARGAQTYEGRGVATRADQLVAFLRDAGVRPTIDSERCLTAIERAAVERDAAVAALERQNSEIAEKLAEADRLARLTRMTLMAAVGLFVLLLAAMAIGFFALRRRLFSSSASPSDPPAAAPATKAPIVESAAIPQTSPVTADFGASVILPPPAPKRRNLLPVALVAAGGAAAAALVVPLAIQAMESGASTRGLIANLAGEQQCRFDPRASETADEDMSFTIDGEACVDGRTPYAPTHDGRSLQRVLWRENENAIDVMTLSPATGELRREQFTLARSDLKGAAEAARAAPAADSCSAASRERVARRNAALMRYASGEPARRVVWRCRRK